MKKRSITRKLLKRHWLAVSVGCLTFLVLYLRLEPRPVRQVNIDLSSNYSIEDSIHALHDMALSRDGNVASILTNNRHAYLFQFDTNQFINIRINNVEQMAFDDQGELVLVTREVLKPNNHQHRLIRYHPASKTQRVIYKENVTYEQKMPDDTFDSFFSGLVTMGLNGNVSALLSPDGQIILKPIIHQNQVILTIINTSDASLRVSLELPSLDLKQPFTPYFEAAFSSDGHTLLIQHSESTATTIQYRLRWLDTKTGRQLGTILLPPSCRMVEPCVVGPDRTCGRIISSNPYTASYSSKGEEERRLTLDDIPDPSERNRRYYLDPDSKIMAYLWENVETEKTQLSVRSLLTGKLSFQQLWAFPDKSNPRVTPNTYSIETVLPGSLILIVTQETTPTDLLEQWIEKGKNMLKLKTDYPRTSLSFIDAHAGQVRGLLRLPYLQVLTKHLPEMGILCITYLHDGYLHASQYDNTLRKPWLYILFLSLLSLLSIVMLLEFSCLLVWIVRRGITLLFKQKNYPSTSPLLG